MNTATRTLMSEPALYCLGSINLDFQVRTERWPEDGETLNATDFLRAPGGKAANRAFLARKLGAPGVLIGRVGDDDFGREALEPLRALGVDVTNVSVTSGHSTGVAMIVVRPDGAKTILLAANANAHLADADAERVAVLLARAPAESVVSVDLEVPPQVVAAALKAARARRLRVILDPSPADRMREEYYDYVDWVTPNHTEAMRLSGIEISGRMRAREAARRLADMGARGVCVKLSDGGCVALVESEEYLVDAPKVNVVDKTGAGDAFASALAVAVFERQPTREALRFAVYASSLATTRYGSQAAYRDRETLEAALGELRA